MNKRAILYSLCATAMAMSGLVLGAAPASASIHNTPGYVHIANEGSGKCIDATDAGAVQWRCLNTFNEEWQFIDVYPEGLEIVSHSSGDCLTVADPSVDEFQNGTPVVLAPCAYSPFPWPMITRGQTWFRNPDHPLVLVAGQGKCLDLENGDAHDGVPLQIWDCNYNTSNQRWYRQ
ncbi:MAG TPA: RICIN domain-containing protein [Streptosporangiaceae bacterium]|nr:RICIN domain-containing protein [Streptosporangiaceae bacterium]